jgi:hypothetical protein
MENKCCPLSGSVIYFRRWSCNQPPFVSGLIIRRRSKTNPNARQIDHPDDAGS